MSVTVVTSADALDRVRGSSEHRYAHTTFALHRNSHGAFVALGIERHCARLSQGAATLGYSLPLSHQALATSVRSYIGTCIAAQPQNYRITIIAHPHTVYLYSAPYSAPWSSLKSGIDLIATVAERTLPGTKATFDTVAESARARAVAQGAHEALLYGRDRIIREGAWSNFFWFDTRGATFVTPKENILHGITRALILESGIIPVRCCTSSYDEVMQYCGGAFCTQATSGITLVRSIDGVPIKNIPELQGTLELLARSLYDYSRFAEVV